MGTVIGFHLVMTYYGFWLPNDERGSWSNRVWARHLRRFGPATGQYMEQSSAHDGQDPTVRAQAKEALKYPPVVLTGPQALVVAQGFGECLAVKKIRCLACAILPEHTHLVLENAAQDMDDLATDLKAAAVKRLLAAGMHPFQDYAASGAKLPKMWARGDFCRYLFTRDQVVERIDYVEQNPVKAGLKPQTWSFVVRVY